MERFPAAFGFDSVAAAMPDSHDLQSGDGPFAYTSDRPRWRGSFDRD
jgi:hypothetical protein